MSSVPTLFWTPQRWNYTSAFSSFKRILTARLIEISLEVEDYVYKHKPISVFKAEQYIREVSSYKPQCSEDERFLQVIEKLTRCMKAIILDHQELGADKHTINNDTCIANGSDSAGSISPVYSIPDEDRTQFSQIAEARAINDTISNKDIEIIDLSHIDDDDDFIHNEASTATADYTNSRLTVEVEIHRGMSSLSLRDIGNPLEMISTDVNCSQSILNNFEGIEQMQQNEINIVSQGAVIDGLVATVADEGKTTKVMHAGGNTMFDKIPNNKTTPIIEPKKTEKTITGPNKPIIHNTKISNVVKTTNYSLPNTEKDYTISSQTFHPATNNFSETQRTNRTCTIIDSSHILKEANRLTKSRDIYKLVNPVTGTNAASSNVNITKNTLNAARIEKHIINASETLRTLSNNTAIVKGNPIATKKKRGPRKKKDIDEDETKPNNKRIYRPAKSNKENTKLAKNINIPIYNENVVNDLSWIENIRYVREIKVDENDPKLNLEDSFWDNYYLPANWSENEFV